MFILGAEAVCSMATTSSFNSGDHAKAIALGCNSQVLLGDEGHDTDCVMGVGL